MAIRDLVTCLYHADDGAVYRTKQDAAVIGQTIGSGPARPITGAVALTGADTHEEIPRGLKPRGVYVTASGDTRFVVCMTATADLFVGTATTVDLSQIGSATAVTYTRHKAKSERDYRKEAKSA